jgi:aminoglycoside phosphotransferase (APT) family kinase protein
LGTAPDSIHLVPAPDSDTLAVPVDPALRRALEAANLLRPGEAVSGRSLTGGVSSDLLLLEAGDRRFVVKRALARLRVRDDWRADPTRNRFEWEWLKFAGRVVPEAVPKVLHADESAGWFAMEYFGAPWRTWKADLLAGEFDPAVARRAGATLGQLHRASWGDPELRRRFATLGNFTELRLSPYLLTTAERVPDLRPWLQHEAEQLANAAVALVHGDYSPKNLLVAPGGLIVLDAEVAWFGDPAFDIAFLLNHLVLKALLHAPASAGLLALAAEAWEAYDRQLGAHRAALEPRVVRLVLALMLARVHGKSPVEYLAPRRQDWVTRFVGQWALQPPARCAALIEILAEALRKVPQS